MTEGTNRSYARPDEARLTSQGGFARRDRARYVVRLGEAAAAGPERVGGKAATLSRLLAAGFPVPDGLVLTTDAFHAAHHQVEATAPSGGTEVPLPPDIAAALHAGLRALGEGPVAVRSSGVSEDAAGNSYAGQYESVLNVRGPDAVARAVRHCWASAHSERIEAYRPARAARGPAPMAILIQRMVPADAAGVAFTGAPVTGGREATVIHAVRGTGERLVAGEATPEAWTVRNGVTDDPRESRGVLDEPVARAIAELAERIEAQAGTPQDVEWALENGLIHVLQARPITSLPTPPEVQPPPGPWMKDTVHYQGPITPLAATSYLPRLQQGGTRLCELGIPMEGILQRSIGWEVYGQPVPPTSDELIQERIRIATDTIRQDRPSQLVRRWREEWRDAFAARLEELRTRDLSALDDVALDAHLQACLDLLEHGQEVHFQLFVPYILAAHDLAKTCERLLGWDLSSALDLVSGLSEASVEPARDLAEIAAEARAHPEAEAELRAWRPATPLTELLDRIREGAPTIVKRLQDHVDRFGCRVPAYDVGDPTYAERPERTLRLLQDLVAGYVDPEGTRDELARAREAAAERARAELAERGAPEEMRHEFERVLARARDVWGLREENLLYTDAMPNGSIRLAALEIGRRLVTHGRLHRAEDAVWLELDELRTALPRGDEPGPEGLLGRVDRRRREHAWVRAHPGPSLYGDPPPPPPPKDDFPEEARLLIEAFDWMMGLEYGPPAASEEGDTLHGQAGSPGRVTAPVRVIHDPSEVDALAPGEVLVCRLTTPAWTVLFARAGAVVTDTGSPLSHAAIVAREYGIPAVVGTQAATTLLSDGETVTVDGAAGTVTRATTAPA